ncbi:MAG: hypothetical protein HY204_07320 [Nitrospirae bacterium]|nr:hypothetical protein [Nitrospirota bacterium]
MNVKTIGVGLLAMIFLFGPTASAQMGGGGMMKGDPAKKKEMLQERNQKMHEMMGEMMGMMHEMMGDMKGMMQDPSMKQRMDDMMKKMDDMMKQHEEMMKGMGMGMMKEEKKEEKKGDSAK